MFDTAPKHRATDRDESRSYTEADCTGLFLGSHWACPRHEPVAYADSMARHATDSLLPLGTLSTRWLAAGDMPTPARWQ